MRNLASTRRFAAVLCTAILVWLSGCAGKGPLRQELADHVERPPRSVVLFLCDGVNADLLEEGCGAGWLPNIEQRFCQGGTRVQNAITIHPSITYASVTTLLTGLEPPEHRIPGNRWFDPQQRLLRDYAYIATYVSVNEDTDAETVYELIAPAYSMSVQSPLRRGVSDNIANWAQSGVRWFFRDYPGVDALTAKTVELVARRANRAGQWPALLTLYFPGLDSVGHERGATSPEYHAALLNLDLHVGRVCDWLEEQGLLSTTYLLLVADHGMIDVDPCRHVDLVQALQQTGASLTHQPCQNVPYERRRRHFDKFEQVITYEDGRCAFVYFKGPSGWDQRPTTAAVHERLTSLPPEWQLWNLDGVDLVAYLADDDEAILRSARGEARVIERLDGETAVYRYVPSPDDVLGYLENPELAAFVNAGFHDAREWLAATCTDDVPALVPDIVPLLHEPRVGQAIVFAAAGCSFVADQPGGHGGIRRGEMRVPLMIAGPDIQPRGVIECARTVDVVPTIMTLLDVEPPTELPGVPVDLPHL